MHQPALWIPCGNTGTVLPGSPSLRNVNWEGSYKVASIMIHFVDSVFLIPGIETWAPLMPNLCFTTEPRPKSSLYFLDLEVDSP